MKKVFKLKAIQRIAVVIALVAIIGFSFAACGNSTGSPGPDGPTSGSGQYTAKDVLGNSYSISFGSDASRAAGKGDRFSMNVKGRDGKTRSANGKVKDISADGTLTLETDEGVEFTAVVDGDNLGSVASDAVQIPLSDETKLTPRTFDNIYLRANRWSSDGSAGKMHGEQWGSGLTVLVKDFPTNVSKLVKDDSRYTITVSGTVDKALPHVRIEVQGLTAKDEWVYLAGTSNEGESISAGQFTKTYNLGVTDDTQVSLNLLDYKEIILQTTEVIQMIFDDHPEWNADVNYGSIPADIPNGQIMATISNFNIVLKDKNRDAFKGNTNDYTYGYKEDGFSVNYQLAVWSLTPENIAALKKQNATAIFEFIMVDVDDILDPGTTLCFAWQDPVRELWWQDEINISDWTQAEDWHLADGVTWEGWRKKVTIDLSKIIKDSRFYAATELNFIIGCWWNNDADCENISDISITGANIYSLPTCGGNMGNYVHGTLEDGISIDYQSIKWHLSPSVLATAKGAGAKLELVFSKDIANTSLLLLWDDSATERWWPSEEEYGTDFANLYIHKNSDTFTGVTYDSSAKKLTVVLDQALETYSDSAAKPDGRKGFESATDVNLWLYCWGGADDITELGIVSANIVNDGETVVGSYNANESNPHNSLSSSVNYQIVNLPAESKTNVLKVVNPGEWAVALYDLSSYKDQNKTVTFSAQVKRVGAAGTLNWQINNDDYPSVGDPINNAPADTWHNMSGTWTGTPADEHPKLYLSTYENNSGTTTYYIYNFTITVTP